MDQGPEDSAMPAEIRKKSSKQNKDYGQTLTVLSHSDKALHFIFFLTRYCMPLNYIRDVLRP